MGFADFGILGGAQGSGCRALGYRSPRYPMSSRIFNYGFVVWIPSRSPAGSMRFCGIGRCKAQQIQDTLHLVVGYPGP